MLNQVALIQSKFQTTRQAHSWMFYINCGTSSDVMAGEQDVPYSLNQTLWLLFISSTNFVRLLFESDIYFTQLMVLLPEPEGEGSPVRIYLI